METKEPKIKTIAKKILADKKIIQEKGIKRATEENGIKFIIPKSLSNLSEG
jgi:hypothetical protein